jgi:murein L,D-transpeptidase YcbB/YkuD
MVLRPVVAGVIAAAAMGAASAQESVLRCVTETTAEISRRICAPAPVSADIKVDLPDVAPPVVTDSGNGLAFKLALPEPPPATVVIAPRELVAVAPPPPPVFPVIAVLPPEPPAAPAAPMPVQPPAPAQATGTPVIDAPMPAEALQTALKRLKASARISDQEAAEAYAFYEKRGFKPLWIEDGRWGDRALSLRATFARAHEDGLDPLRYRSVSQFITVGEPHWPALAAAETQMTEAALAYARDAAIGRIRPNQVHPLITPRLRQTGADKVLAELSEAQDVGAALESFHPPHPQYRALKTALAGARANRPAIAAGEPIPDGPPLRVGMTDPRVPLIRERLGMGYDSTSVYDRAVSVRVATLQKANGLQVNGLFTAQTRRALVGEGPTPEEAEIIANMEFWRWMPRELGEEHILVNTPAYDMQFRRDGQTILQSRIIVGKYETQTPFFSDEMDHIVVNPSWYIPPGILKREPKYLDPAYAAARGYELRTRGNITTVRVPPGSSNALGYVKFMFPNDHAVYLHDTPNRGLFNARVRTLSNGCVRVENPMRLAALLFESEGISEERFRRMQGGGERRMNLPRKVQVHLAYFTMTVDQDGAIERHPDVYGHAAAMRRLLGLS